ncbi:MAG: hypothetical protein SH847_24185 [Roseiflexaceae bacterium]|nr:hypothetical protein [Roseiflexaceae bacterium]
MQRYRLSIVVAVGLVALVAIGVLVGAGSSNSQAEESQPLLQMPDFPPTPTIPPQPASVARLQSGATLFSDSFDTADSLKNWQIVDVQQALPGEESVWKVVDGRLLQDRTARAYNPDFRDTMAITGSPEWTNYTISSKVYDAASATLGLVVRRQGDSFYRFRMFADGTSGDQKLVLEKVVGGVATELASSGGPGYAHNRWYTIAVSVSGPQIQATIDGALVLQATDSALTRGQAGLTTIAFGAVNFDDVMVTTP